MPHPVSHFALQLLQRVIIVSLGTLIPKGLAECVNFLLKLDSLANVCFGIYGYFLNPFLQIFECILKLFRLCHLTVLGLIDLIVFLSFLLHCLQVG